MKKQYTGPSIWLQERPTEEENEREKKTDRPHTDIVEQ